MIQDHRVVKVKVPKGIPDTYAVGQLTAYNNETARVLQIDREQNAVWLDLDYKDDLDDWKQYDERAEAELRAGPFGHLFKDVPDN